MYLVGAHHPHKAEAQKDAISPAIQLTLDIVDVLRAREIVQNPAGLSARDAIHLAIMERMEFNRF